MLAEVGVSNGNASKAVGKTMRWSRRTVDEFPRGMSPEDRLLILTQSECLIVNYVKSTVQQI